MINVNPQLAELVAYRAELYAQLAEIGDFRRGSISENYRRCGKPNCACARPGHPGHGPRRLWTRSEPGGKTAGRQLAPGEIDKVRHEIETYRQFTELTGEIVTVNEQICEARPAAPPGQVGAEDSKVDPVGQKGGS
jgi:hypothetical protein